MSQRLITAAGSLLDVADGPPEEIVYLPEGQHRITPYVDGKPKSITVTVDPAKGAQLAAALQADLEKRQAANVRPWFDFEHKAAAASALPVSFRYAPGKGVMCAVEWTAAGRAAVAGKDFSYFSPTFLLAEDGTPAGLPPRGPLGGLVNEPAFRDIPRIAASDAAESNPITMKLLLAKLGIDAAAADAETAAIAKVEAALSAEERLAALEQQIAALTEERDAMQAECSKMKAACADATSQRLSGLIEAAVAAGKIAPKDEETKGQALELLTASEALGVKFLAALPAKFAALAQPVVSAAGAAPLTIEAAQAQARAELGADATFISVWERAQEIAPTAFDA